MTVDSSILHIRPRFEFEVPFSKQRVLERIKEVVANSKDKVIAEIVDDHIILDVLEEHRHYWSPQLNFRIETSEINPIHTSIKGLIGPRPAVWTMYMFIYFSIGTAGFVISAFGISKWMIGQWSNYVLVLPLSILFMLTAYITSKYGQRLGRDQIEILKQFVREALSINKDL